MLPETAHKPVHILLIEDDETDVEALKRAFAQNDISYPMSVASDGESAMALLRGSDERPPLPQPTLILLDLSLPRMDGFEFLEQLRSDDRLRCSVVFVLTTSNNARDKLRAYEQMIAGYIVKSYVGPHYEAVTSLIERYQNAVEFPPTAVSV